MRRSRRAADWTAPSDARGSCKSLPRCIAGICVLGDALREAGRLDEADLTLAEAVKRFPDALWAAVQHALVAVRRQDWSEALKRWELTRFRFPSMLNGYIVPPRRHHAGAVDLAVEKWQAVRLNFPDEHTGYVGQADALAGRTRCRGG